MGNLQLDQHIFRSQEYQSVVEKALDFFINTPLQPLPPTERFTGSGVYAIYYLGNHAFYEPLTRANRIACVQPIYTGKAVPPGWRTGRIGRDDSPTLWQRLNEHGRSIASTELDLKDFRCRFMLLSGIEADLVVPVEAGLIRRYVPLWNTVVDGFGNHDPGKGRYQQAPSEWDILHPGRQWVVRLLGDSPLVDLIHEKMHGYFSRHFPDT